MDGASATDIIIKSLQSTVSLKDPTNVFHVYILGEGLKAKSSRPHPGSLAVKVVHRCSLSLHPPDCGVKLFFSGGSISGGNRTGSDYDW